MHTVDNLLTMIAVEGDDGVVGQAELIQGIKKSANLSIRVADGSGVALSQS